MASILRLFVKKWLIVIVPFLLVSNAQFSIHEEKNIPKIFDNPLIHETHFAIGDETTYDGREFSALKIHMVGLRETFGHTVEFTISKKKSSGEISTGRYKVAKDSNGLLTYIDGVFGFINNENSGDLPFFATSGEVVLSDMGKEVIKGSINLYFQNSIGHSLHVSGEFAALPR